jgi:tetratricopeptide (TPR) repeat protein
VNPVRNLSGAARGLVVLGPMLALLVGCAGGAAALASTRTDEADKWYQRANAAFIVSDIDDARDSADKALQFSKDDPETRLLAGKIALARLEFPRALQYLKPIKCETTSDEHCKKLGLEAASLRGRAHWYNGELDAAADELEAVLNDPDSKDEWAKAVAKLARQGQGRQPFAISGGLLAATELIHASPDYAYFLIEVDIDGERALALIHTGKTEVAIDSATRAEPSWVSIRIGDRLEVKDVPAVPEDLSGLTKELGAPVKALLGVNFLRHVNATIDYEGHQFVARSYSPTAPPDATRLPLLYVKGGGMIVRSGFGGEKGPVASLLLNTGSNFAVTLTQAGWKKAGIDVDTLKPVPQVPDTREGTIGMLRIGAFDVPQVQGLYSTQQTQFDDMAKALAPVAFDGVLGAGLLSRFRCTLGDGGRVMWLEDATALAKVLNGGTLPPKVRGNAPALPGPVNSSQAPAPPAKK